MVKISPFRTIVTAGVRAPYVLIVLVSLCRRRFVQVGVTEGGLARSAADRGRSRRRLR